MPAVRPTLLAVIIAVSFAGLACTGKPATTTPTPTAVPATSTTAATATETPDPTPLPSPTSQPAAAGPTQAPTRTFEIPPPAPKADLFTLARDLGKKDPALLVPLSRRETNHQPGLVETFNVVDFAGRKVNTIRAELKYTSPVAYLYVEQGVNLSQRGLEATATEIESKILPAIRRYVHSGFDPGLGVDSRLTVLHTRLSGAAGYVSSLDLLPTAVYRYSNQRPVVYMSISGSAPGTQRYYSTLAHEIQHLAHFQAQPGQETWAQEGMSELFSELAGYPGGFSQPFLANPDVHLLNWDGPEADGIRHYGAAHLFLRYAGSQVGYDTLPAFINAAEPGLGGLGQMLKQAGDSRSPDEMVRDWTIANILPSSQAGGRYAYPDPKPLPVALPSPSAPGPHDLTVAQYAAGYLVVEPADTARVLRFDGAEETRILPVAPAGGKRVWWSNRGDHVASTLTREFDLTSVQSARLIYRLWYDIEEQFDYAYVLASADGGKTWQDLRGTFSTQQNDLGQSLGWGYTGQSGAEWVTETVDLTAYAGRRVILRFLSFTDEAVNHTGLALDDISVPEIGFFDGAEDEAGWKAEGFVRTDNRLPQRFFVTVVYPDQGQVSPVELDAEHRGQANVPAGRRAVLVVTALAPVTSVRADYRVTVGAG